jgi:hypothetical protein
MTGPLDKPPNANEMRDVWAKVTRHHEIRTGNTDEGKRDVYVMDVSIRWLDVIAQFPDDFQRWANNRVNPPKKPYVVGRR